MTDIVERLRAGTECQGHGYELMKEAAAEIELLRAKSGASVELMQSERNVSDMLREENAKLRAQLDEVRGAVVVDYFNYQDFKPQRIKP